MKASAVYRKAAESMDADKIRALGCCYWIEKTSPFPSDEYTSPAHLLFEQWFPWRTSENTWGDYRQQLDMGARILALLLMSEIARSES